MRALCDSSGIGTTGFASALASESAPPPSPEQGPWARRVEAFAVRHRGKLAWIHLGMFAFFVAVMVVPLFLPLPGDRATFFDNFTLFANFAIWGLWFPLVFVSVLLAGRAWCGVLCPLGACSEWANRIGSKRSVPGWVRWRGTPIVSFAIVTVLAQTVGARDHPEGLAEVFGLAFAGAVVLGFVYGQGRSKRAWCRHMCPIGLMLGVFSRLGAVQFAPKRPRAGGDAYVERGICPTMVDIDRKSESRHCIECLRCVNPGARGGLKLVFRRPGAEVARIREHNPNAAEVWFLFLATGLSLGGFLWLVLPQYQWLRQALGDWAINRGWYWIGNPGPGWLMSVHPAAREVFTWLDFLLIVGFMLACALVLTAGLAALTALASRLCARMQEAGAQAEGVARRRFVELGYAYMPVAMVSLVIGLGGKLFEALAVFGAPGQVVGGMKLGLFALSIAWSVALNHRLLGGLGLAGLRRWAAALPQLAGVSLVAFAWWPAIFGA